MNRINKKTQFIIITVGAFMLCTYAFSPHAYAQKSDDKKCATSVCAIGPISQKAAPHVVIAPEKRTPWQIEEFLSQKADQKDLRLELLLKHISRSSTGPFSETETVYTDKNGNKVAFPPVPERPSGSETLSGRAAQITVPVGPVAIAKKGAIKGAHAFKWLEKQVDLVKNTAGRKKIAIEMWNIPVQLQEPLKKLLEIKHIKVCVPGTDFAIAETYKITPRRTYSVPEKLFTIDSITLEKTDDDKFEIYIPSHAKADFENKILRLTGKKDAGGKTPAQRLAEREVKTLAMCLAEWARYESCGFNFDEKTEDLIAKAVIGIVGVGAHDSATGTLYGIISEEQPIALLLENEILNIVDEDREAWGRIMDYLYPGRQKR